MRGLVEVIRPCVEHACIETITFRLSLDYTNDLVLYDATKKRPSSVVVPSGCYRLRLVSRDCVKWFQTYVELV